MALSRGTNCGFVLTAPTTDPNGSANTIDNNSNVFLDTSPSNATKIIEVGWWCNNATQAANFEVGLYAADGTVVPGEAGTRLFVAATNAKGTTSGWKVATVDWAISSSTNYWLALQLDNTSTNTTTDITVVSAGQGYWDELTSQTTLNNPYGGGAIANNNILLALYAKYEVAAGPANLKTYNTNAKANIKTINTNTIANVKTLNTNI